MTPEEIRYAKILREILAGKGISKKDESFFADYTNTVDDSTLKKIQNSEFKDYTSEDVETAVSEGYKQLIQSPEYKEKMLDFAEKAEKGKVASSVRNALNIALGAADIAASVKQTREGERVARRSRRPQQPAALKADPLLAQAIEEARVGTFDTASQNHSHALNLQQSCRCQLPFSYTS